MSEIEELQQEMNRADAAAASSPAKLHAVTNDAPTSTSATGEDDDILKEFQTSPTENETSVDESLMDLKADESTTSLLDPDEKETPMNHDRDSAAEGAMTLTMSGSMSLRLNYEISGQVVTIGFVDQTLTVELADGTEFKIPLHRSSAKAA